MHGCLKPWKLLVNVSSWLCSDLLKLVLVRLKLVICNFCHSSAVSISVALQPSRHPARPRRHSLVHLHTWQTSWLDILQHPRYSNGRIF